MLAYLIGKVVYLYSKKMIFENQYKGLWINIHKNNDFVVDNRKIIKIYCCNYQPTNLKNLFNNEIYGFHYLPECELFVDLVSINGIGPRTALNIVSNGAKEIVWMIGNKAIDSLSGMNGISRKLAITIINNLADKYLLKTANFHKDKEKGYTIEDVHSALKNLGYNEAEIKYGINEAISENRNNSEKLSEISDFIAYAIKAIAQEHSDTNSQATEI